MSVMTKTRVSWIVGIILIVATVCVGAWLMHEYKSVSDDYAAPRVSDDVSEKAQVERRPEEIGEWNTYHGDAALSGTVSAIRR